MPFVLDASVAACWAFPDESHSVATAALKRTQDDEAWAPGLWWFEVRNTMISSERRGRISVNHTTAFLQQLARLQISIDHSANELAVLTIARRHKLTVYDAAYLELAQRKNLPLATLDHALAKAAITVGVPLIDHIV
jgi:predicted nucleic acid-binding protein